ncbi:MAG: NAD/NADP octopine/nopaline dehydrogenase family protein [Coriobacteriales bacterium]|jgi:hypothetical protein|nr:NAD/NADP octopine/nopaline dehydrogenase family protein [Coriobacteriales bacterium]
MNMKVCVSGGGNIGIALCCYLKQTGCELSLLTSKPTAWGNAVTYTEGGSDRTFEVALDTVTDDPQKALSGAGIIFITQPSFLIEDLIARLEPFLDSGTVICFVPGPGGKEFVCDRLLARGFVIAGLDRAPCVSRIQEPYRSVIASKKPAVRCGTLPAHRASSVASLIASLLDMTCLPLANYFTVSLTPTNPILHTARLFSLLGNPDSSQNTEGFTHKLLFYGEWDDRASSCLLNMDAELQTICASFDNMDLSGVIPLTEHYESATVQELTDKIRSIRSLKNISAPLLERDGRWEPDRNSRYFREDFPFGLCELRAFADIASVSCPTIDKALTWYEQFAGVQYYRDGSFTGEGLTKSLLPQHYGLRSKQDIGRFYLG